MPCEKLFYTLEIHPSLTQEVTAVNINRFAGGNGNITPDIVNDVQPVGFTPNNTPFEGGGLASRLQWTVSCVVTDAEFLQIKALYAWQQRRKRADLDARLQWTDRFEPTEPEPSGSLSRDIIDAKTTGDGLTYGSPVVSCVMTRPSGQITSRAGATETMRLCSFVITERSR